MSSQMRGLAQVAIHLKLSKVLADTVARSMHIALDGLDCGFISGPVERPKILVDVIKGLRPEEDNPVRRSKGNRSTFLRRSGH